MASSRQFRILNPAGNYAYGLNPEKAWNYGFNFVQNFQVSKRKASFALDIYRTDFRKQVVVDVDANPQQVSFYNLKGASYSNSVQMQLDLEPIEKLEVRLAYRWLDVYQNEGGRMLEKPLLARNRAFINIAYQVLGSWKLDLTTQYFGKKRLPSTASNPVSYQLAFYSPAFFQMNAQVSKQWKKKWTVYLGGENLTNYIQKKLFIAGDQPFSRYFDGSVVWGPVNGALIYAGIRHSIM
jgi:outer membrane receptor protein involved in Fe transport